MKEKETHDVPFVLRWKEHRNSFGDITLFGYLGKWKIFTIYRSILGNNLKLNVKLPGIKDTNELLNEPTTDDYKMLAFEICQYWLNNVLNVPKDFHESKELWSEFEPEGKVK